METLSSGVVPAESSLPLRLDELSPRQCATVCQVDAQDGSADQLMAMGVCIGRQVEVVKCGDPLILRVLGSRIGLSARLAQRVFVKSCSGSTCSTQERS